MILHDDDDECFLVLAENQVRKVLVQIHYILKALKTVSSYYENKKIMTWGDACEEFSDEVLSKHSGRAIEF